LFITSQRETSMESSTNKGKTQPLFNWVKDRVHADKKVENPVRTFRDVKAIHDLGAQILLDWLDSPPADWRQMRALNLLADAVQLLHASCINLDLGNEPDEPEPVLNEEPETEGSWIRPLPHVNNGGKKQVSLSKLSH
jgi:hypothetical protein